MTVSDEKPFFAPRHHETLSPRQPIAGELLFEFHIEVTHTFWRVELRDHGPYGVEAQFLDPVELRFAQTFRRDMDPTRTPRDMAIGWAREFRAELESR